MHNKTWMALLAAGFVILAGLLAWEWRQSSPTPHPQSPPARPPATYAGAAACGQCHAREFALWRGSHHDLAMQHAVPESVAGDFNDAKFTYAGVTSTFFRRGDVFFVNTDGPDGSLQDFAIKYTFGVTPLQQYLIEFPDGRIQALSVAWDARPRAEGGQGWFHLYPDQRIDHRDPLHWTRLQQNWNYMCAECHTTGLQRGYDGEQNRFDTRWSDIDVACESCHGPGSAHIAWAKEGGDKAQGDGLTVHFPTRSGWLADPASGNAHRTAARTEHTELETCALCHSRRSQFKEGHRPGRPLLDTHRVSLLEEHLYTADGQMQDEVFNYGSFVQSKMFAKGVTCGDCHEPHSLKLRGEGDAVCAQCHAPGKYTDVSHHRHQAGSAGSACVDCHMPARTYMVVDRRHDHSFRIPRPDLSVTLGTPNACNDCHSDKTAQWASRALESWFGSQRKGFQQFAPALHAARTESLEAPRLLRELVRDYNQPAIARATAFAELAPYLSTGVLEDFRAGLSDADALVRLGALQGLAGLPLDHHWTLITPLLTDPVRAVRLEAASLLAPLPAQSLNAAQQAALQAALDEYIAAQQLNADRPEAHLNLGALYAQRGDAAAAEREYRAALHLDPQFVQASINLADLYRDLQRDDDGEQVLREALVTVPDSAAVRHALGLLLVRRQQLPQALTELAAAAKREPGQARYGYVYAVALHSTGQVAQALSLLERLHKQHPADREILMALLSFYREQGNNKKALEFARKIQLLTPDDPGIGRLLQALE